VGLKKRVRNAFASPIPLDDKTRRLLFILIVASFVAGYQGSLLSTMLTYPARQWNKSSASQADLLAVLRFDVLASLAIVRLADRMGRKRLLIICSLIAPLFTALGALSNSLATLGITQFVSRSLTTAVAILITVYVAEEFPTGTRSWATGVLVACAAAGSAILLVAAAAADRTHSAWRFPFVFPLLTVPILGYQFRTLHESTRFQSFANASWSHTKGPNSDTQSIGLKSTRYSRTRVDRTETFGALRLHYKRLLLVAVFALVVAFEQTPARQLQNDFLRSERHFSSFTVSVFGIFSNAPGLIGLFLGSTLSDRFGRKLFLTIGLAGFAIGDAGMFLSHGYGLWGWSVIGALIGGMSLPALAVYSAELFPTVMRATANGLITGAARAGGAFGLLAVGWFAGSRTGPSLALTTVGLWVAIVFILPFLPETAKSDLD
jgi:MFS family permease